jgi:hypothetical protein
MPQMLSTSIVSISRKVCFANVSIGCCSWAGIEECSVVEAQREKIPAKRQKTKEKEREKRKKELQVYWQSNNQYYYTGFQFVAIPPFNFPVLSLMLFSYLGHVSYLNTT